MISGSFEMLENNQWTTPYHMHDIEQRIRKFQKVSPVSVKYHKNIMNIIMKHASLNIIVAILAKKFVLYSRCSFIANFMNCMYFFILDRLMIKLFNYIFQWYIFYFYILYFLIFKQEFQSLLYYLRIVFYYDFFSL